MVLVSSGTIFIGQIFLFWNYVNMAEDVSVFIPMFMILIYIESITNLIATQGAVSIRKTVLPGMAIPMLKIRRPNGRLIFNMEIAIRR